MHAGFGGRGGETGWFERPVPRSVSTLLKPVSYGFRPKRRAQDAIAEIHFYGTHGYRWVLDADIAACFDEIDHAALMDRVRMRIKDKRVLVLVKAFLKAGLLTELGEYQDTFTGTPQGGILSPLLANIALSVLDEHLHRGWEPGGELSTDYRRGRRRAVGLPSWRLVRYADLCRTRHRSAYAACRVMPNRGDGSVVDQVAGFENFSIIRGVG